jgi:ubiquinone/menaquinone biosynthesis C-methylase UbiE
VHPVSLMPLATAVMRVPPPERALVVECGEGEEVLLLAREFPSSRVRGVDRSAETIHRASAKVGLDPEGRVAFKRGKPRSLPFPGEMFDLVAQTHGTLFVGEALRVLRPGGHLIYVERPPWRLLPVGTKRLARRLDRLGLETVELGESEGSPFYVGRLGS